MCCCWKHSRVSRCRRHPSSINRRRRRRRCRFRRRGCRHSRVVMMVGERRCSSSSSKRQQRQIYLPLNIVSGTPGRGVPEHAFTFLTPCANASRNASGSSGNFGGGMRSPRSERRSISIDRASRAHANPANTSTVARWCALVSAAIAQAEQRTNVLQDDAKTRRRERFVLFDGPIFTCVDGTV